MDETPFIKVIRRYFNAIRPAQTRRSGYLRRQNHLQSIAQARALFVGTHGDAKVLPDARRLKVTHQDALLAQRARNDGGFLAAMTGKDEIGSRRQYVETQFLQSRRQPGARFDDGLAGAIEPDVVLDGC